MRPGSTIHSRPRGESWASAAATCFGNGRIRGTLEQFLSGGRDLMPTAFKWFPPTWVSILVQFDTHYGATSMGNTRSLVISAAKARQAWMSSLVSEG